VADDFDFATEADPERIVASLAERVAAEGGGLPHKEHEGEHPEAVSVRIVTHRGHRIVVRTHYEIDVDGQPFNPPVTVDVGGRVYYHGLPTRDFASVVDLVRKAIDTFPDDFAERTGHDGEGLTRPDDQHHTRHESSSSPGGADTPEGQQ
jgi:hypothetical protein